MHGVNEILMPDIMDELEGKAAGHMSSKCPFNGNDVFGARDETLVFTDRLENVPEEYQKSRRHRSRGKQKVAMCGILLSPGR